MFKKRARPKTVRVQSRDVSDGSDEETPDGASTPVEDLLTLRKLRKSQQGQGIDLEKFNRGEVAKRKTEPDIEFDKFGLNTKTNSATPELEDENARAARKVRSNNFTGQTNALDVDKHMMAYIEKEMAKRKGEEGTTEEAEDSDPEAVLFALAERYREQKKLEEGNVTSSLGMLSAVPEVDLGMENRLRNIEETEKAKREMQERRREPRADMAASSFFGTARETDIQKEMENARREAKGLPPKQVRERPQKPQMATDDQVYERFKKRARR